MNYYIAKIAARQCLADIRINDVPIFRRVVDGDLTVQSPINYLIESSGRQSLTVQLLPVVGDVRLRQGAMCNVELWRYDGSGPKIIPMEQVGSSDVVVGEGDQLVPYKHDKILFYADVSHRISRWSDCVVLENNRQTANAAGQFFEMIGEMLANRQYDRYTQLISQRENDICTALSLDEKETRRRNEMLFGLLDKGLEWQPMQGNLRLMLYANKRVVTIVDRDMKSALKFKSKETGETLSLELLLGRKIGSRSLSII